MKAHKQPDSAFQQKFSSIEQKVAQLLHRHRLELQQCRNKISQLEQENEQLRAQASARQPRRPIFEAKDYSEQYYSLSQKVQDCGSCRQLKQQLQNYRKQCENLAAELYEARVGRLQLQSHLFRYSIKQQLQEANNQFYDS